MSASHHPPTNSPTTNTISAAMGTQMSRAIPRPRLAHGDVAPHPTVHRRRTSLCQQVTAHAGPRAEADRSPGDRHVRADRGVDGDGTPRGTHAAAHSARYADGAPADEQVAAHGTVDG